MFATIISVTVCYTGQVNEKGDLKMSQSLRICLIYISFGSLFFVTILCCDGVGIFQRCFVVATTDKFCTTVAMLLFPAVLISFNP